MDQLEFSSVQHLTGNVDAMAVELNVVHVPQHANRRAAVQRKIDKVDADLLKTTNEALLDVLNTGRQHVHLRAKEHVITVQVENVVRARSTAFSSVHVVDDDSHVLADPFH